MGRPDVIDDLYQEGLLAIWLRDETHSPINHQLRTAQDRMIDVRKRGRSVDGRMNPSSARARRWLILPLDRTMYGAGHRSRTVEAYVVDKITVEEILALLTLPERECLGLVYQGFTQPEIARRTGYSQRRIQRMMRAMREKLWPYLHDGHAPGSSPGQALASGPGSEHLRYFETVQAATNRDAPWTEDEDRVILERAGNPAYEVALALGRTLWAVRHRRSRLRKREGLRP
jgi:DNA-directed RNA polymerase specialized sigma24 family protein